MKKIIFLFCLLTFIQLCFSVDQLEVEEARRSMETAFSAYANYISLHSSSDDYSKRLYHNYLNLKEKYDRLKEIFDASQYRTYEENIVYFFSAHEEAGLAEKKELEWVKNQGPVYEIDYRLGWFMYIQGKYDLAIRLFEVALKKAETEERKFPLANLGLARVYVYFAENDSDKARENAEKAKVYLDKFETEYFFTSSVADKKRDYLLKELKGRLNYLLLPSDN
ncbi:MAG: hypothetical protein WC002_07485 [Candidatus Muiribacteriota bacterium]